MLRRTVAGYLFSVLVAVCLLTGLFYQTISAFSAPNHSFASVSYVWVVMAFWVFVITVLPAAVLIYLAERRAWRSVFPYLTFGAVMGLPVVFWFETLIVMECAVIGAVAGFIYWWIAGRSAGLRDKASA